MDCLEYDGQVYDKRKDQTKSKEKKDTIPTIEKVICEYSELYEENNQILDIVSRGFENVQYRVWICNKNTNKWFEATQGYTKPCYAQSACRIIIPKLTEGKYTVSLWIKRDGKAPINKKGYDEYAVFNINCLKSEETTINKELNGVKDNYKVGEAIQLKGSSDTKEEYRYSVYDVLNNEIKVNFKEYNGELSWKADKAGIYLLRIHTKNLESEYKINKLVVVGQPYKKSTGKVAYLTFDDGPSRKVTTRVLKVLDDYNVKATFFVVGEFAERNKDLIREEYRKGHTIGNHTYSHQYKKLYASPTAFVNEINKTDRILKSIIPEYNTKLIRFPGGSMGKSKAYKDAVIDAGYHDMDWNASTGDTTAYLVPVDKLMRNLKNSCKNKKSIIILMHDAPVKTTTADALPQVIEYLKSQGYEFKTLK
nr:polysaccharide deacetylase family protein [Clostridium ganghwense]